MRRLKILFLCTGNSCRSQMAEGWARDLKSDVIEAYSAGVETHGLNPMAVKAMAEGGVDISSHRSKNVAELMDVPFDCVVTVCGHANETCPAWLGRKTRIIHVAFDDPPKLAKDAKTEAQALDCYRRIRDEIREFIEQLPANLSTIPLEIQYGKIASTSSARGSAGNGHPASRGATGYRGEDTAGVPRGSAELGLGCGNPAILAALRPGQVVLDLGSGGGLDAFIAAKKVGANGKVIGVDATPAMVERATAFATEGGYRNIEFKVGQIEHLPMAGNSIDVIISNCVINHAIDKLAAFREAFRVLKPNGEICIADLVVEGKVGPSDDSKMKVWEWWLTVACDKREYLAAMKEAGFRDAIVREAAYEGEAMIAALKGKIISLQIKAWK